MQASSQLLQAGQSVKHANWQRCQLVVVEVSAQFESVCKSVVALSSQVLQACQSIEHSRRQRFQLIFEQVPATVMLDSELMPAVAYKNCNFVNPLNTSLGSDVSWLLYIYLQPKCEFG